MLLFLMQHADCINAFCIYELSRYAGECSCVSDHKISFLALKILMKLTSQQPHYVWIFAWTVHVECTYTK